MDYPIRKWEFTSLVEWAGKSSMAAANLEYPAYVVDADSRWNLVKGLLTGEVKFAAAATLLEPLALMEEVQSNMKTGNYKHIVVDPVTKLYTLHSRRASMAGRLSEAERKKRGYGKNVAKLHIDKADAVEVITNMAMYGVHTYYIWHKRAGIDHQGNQEVRDRISKVEVNTLRQSIDVQLEFTKVVNQTWQNGDKNAQNYLYGITVISARGMAGRPPNVGMTVWDPEGNFWKGMAARLERLIYTGFAGPSQAIAWATSQFEGDPPTDLQAEYDKKKAVWKPEIAGQMYSQWVEYVDALVKDPEAAKKPEKKQPQPTKQPVMEMKYGDGKPVEEGDQNDFLLYQKYFGQIAFDLQTLERAKQMNIEKGNW